MEIDRNLNLVFPLRAIEKPDPKDTTYDKEGRGQRTIFEPVLWAYHSPISEALFRQHFRIIAETKDAIFRKGWNYATNTAISVADLELLDASKRIAEQYETQDFGPALINEIRRLTFIVTPKKDGSGFEDIPAEIAMGRAVISQDEWHDAECAIIFFTCASTMVMKTKQSGVAAFVASQLKGSMTSLSPTEYLASLAILTPAAISEVTKASSVPS